MKSKSNPDFLKKDRSCVSRQLRNIRSKVGLGSRVGYVGLTEVGRGQGEEHKSEPRTGSGGRSQGLELTWPHMLTLWCQLWLPVSLMQQWNQLLQVQWEG